MSFKAGGADEVGKSIVPNKLVGKKGIDSPPPTSTEKANTTAKTSQSPETNSGFVASYFTGSKLSDAAKSFIAKLPSKDSGKGKVVDESA